MENVLQPAGDRPDIFHEVGPVLEIGMVGAEQCRDCYEDYNYGKRAQVELGGSRQAGHIFQKPAQAGTEEAMDEGDNNDDNDQRSQKDYAMRTHG